VGAPPAKAGGFGLRLKAGSIGQPADGTHSSAIIPGGAPVLRQITPAGPAPSRGIAIPGAELIRIMNYPAASYRASVRSSRLACERLYQGFSRASPLLLYERCKQRGITPNEINL